MRPVLQFDQLLPTSYSRETASNRSCQVGKRTKAYTDPHAFDPSQVQVKLPSKLRQESMQVRSFGGDGVTDRVSCRSQRWESAQIVGICELDSPWVPLLDEKGCGGFLSCSLGRLCERSRPVRACAVAYCRNEEFA